MERLAILVNDSDHAAPLLQPLLAGPEAGACTLVLCPPRLTHRVGKWLSNRQRLQWQRADAERWSGISSLRSPTTLRDGVVMVTTTVLPDVRGFAPARLPPATGHPRRQWDAFWSSPLPKAIRGMPYDYRPDGTRVVPERQTPPPIGVPSSRESAFQPVRRDGMRAPRCSSAMHARSRSMRCDKRRTTMIASCLHASVVSRLLRRNVLHRHGSSRIPRGGRGNARVRR